MQGPASLGSSIAAIHSGSSASPEAGRGGSPSFVFGPSASQPHSVVAVDCSRPAAVDRRQVTEGLNWYCAMIEV